MSVPGTLKRHRVAVAANLALLVGAVGIVAVATQADGYRKHDAQLHDGGIWVTDGRDGFHGRINKPIAQLDGVAFAEQDTQLDVVQDGAAVFGINLSAGVLSVIDPGKVTLPDGETAQLPSAPQVQLAGGTLAVLDPAEGTLWAERVDTRRGVDPVTALDTESDPTATTAAAPASRSPRTARCWSRRARTTGSAASRPPRPASGRRPPSRSAPTSAPASP